MAQNQNKMQSVNQRMLVLEMLLTENAYSHMIVRDVLNKYNYLPQQEKSFIKRLYEGTLERQIELDYVIDQYSKVRTAKMKKPIRAIMRMGAYQILYMDAVPDAAACNEAVKLAQKKGFAALKGFVNGVLRNIARSKGDIVYTSLSVKYSMPEWIVDLWTAQLGAETTETVLAGLLKEHPVTVRFRDVPKITGIDMETAVSAVQKALAAQGGTMEQHSYLPFAYIVSGTDDLTRLPYYENGAFVVQDVSSMLAVAAAGIEDYVDRMGFRDGQKAVRVLDLCAAPGGKSMLAADLLEKCDVHYAVISRDVSANKVGVMRENFGRCGLKKVSAEVGDALQRDETFVGTADIVIADVPCSGLGVIGKKRDIKYRVSPESVQEIAVLQRQILAMAVSYLKPGGRLLFCTCTINRDENERHFTWLRDEMRLRPVPLDRTLPECLHTGTTSAGYLQLLPGVHDSDGFFISVFEALGV
ncbi:MAG: 16S rRNA (cytosine(967)-C(5))-methyltransferase RsmB [Lachnospiraceae bacterium]|nr:16S rRNA (cytosine(967)-C(5))-methyltransferase RsmB [Lachnospiraceae bacterium]